MKLNQIMKFEKSNMHKIRFIMNYRIVPGYLFACAICIVIICVVMSIDEAKYTPLAIILFSAIGLLTIVLLTTVPFVRKKEIQLEIGRYNFEEMETEPKKIYVFSDEEMSIHFDSNGMTVMDKFFWYNHLTVRINTSNYLNRVWITILFIINEASYCTIPLNGDTIHMIKEFGIKLENPETMEYIVHHKEDAFNRIYRTGHV